MKRIFRNYTYLFLFDGYITPDFTLEEEKQIANHFWRARLRPS